MTTFVMPRSELVQALEQVKGSVAQKPFIPILTHVLFSGQTVLGYDSEVGVRVNLSVQVPTFNVKATTFLELLKALEAEDVELTVTKDKIHVKCGSHKSSLAQVVEEYPRPNVVIKEGTWRDIPAGFKEAIERAMLAVSGDENNKALSSLYIKGSHVLGGDGKQMVRCSLGEADLPEMLLGKRAVNELLRLGNPSRVALAGNTAVFDFKNLLFLARLREGATFPATQFNELIDRERSVVAVPTGLINALGRLSLLTGEDVKVCMVDFSSPLGTVIKLTGPTASGEELFPPIEGDWHSPQGVNAALAIPLLQYATSWAPAAGEREPLYFSGETAGFEALLAQAKP